MFTIPAEITAKWPPPNYVDPPTRSVVALCVPKSILIGLAMVSVGLRLWTRIYKRRWLGLDDVLLILAALNALCVSILISYGIVNFKWDRHVWDSRTDFLEVGFKQAYFLRIVWANASSFIRLSVLCLFYRLLRNLSPPKIFYITLHIVTVLNVALCLYYLFSGIFPCFPINAYWKPEVPNAKCHDDFMSWRVSGWINTFFEFVLPTLPIIAVYRLKIAREQRWHVISLLSLSYCVGLVGLVRIYLSEVLQRTMDFAWLVGPLWVTAEIEISLSLICACAVSIRPLLSHFAKPRQRPHQKPAPSLTQSDHADWAALMQCIDVEGISTKDYGYKVTISGPITKASRNKGVNFMLRNLLRSEKEESTERVSQDLAIPVEQEVEVTRNSSEISSYETRKMVATTI